MKKRTVKDFIALYAPEDEEKLVLIQDGVSADKTFLDTYWAAHTHALAMADAQTGQVISGRCYLSWPLTDKERDAGDYSKRFTKGQIYPERNAPRDLYKPRDGRHRPRWLRKIHPGAGVHLAHPPGGNIAADYHWCREYRRVLRADMRHSHWAGVRGTAF